MTIAELRSQIASNINRTDITSDQIDQWINNRSKRIMQLDNAYYMDKTVTASTVDGTASYTLPTDYKDELIVSLEDSTAIRVLKKWKGTEPEKGHSTTNTEGKPTNYWIWQDAYYLYPIPDAVYTLRLRYYYYLTALSDDNTSNELSTKFPDLLIAGATSDAFTYLMEVSMADHWEAKYRIFLRGDSVTEGYLPYIRKRPLSNYDSRIRLRLF